MDEPDGAAVTPTPTMAARAAATLWSVAFASAAAVCLGLLGSRFVQSPGLLAPSLDDAWYTWRTQVLLHGDPQLLLTKRGPFGMFSGGYRVTTPVLGGLMNRIAGIDPTRFTVFLLVGLPVLTSLSLALFAYRHKGDPALLMVTFVVSFALLLTVPFLGYLDNQVCLCILAAALPFLGPARTSWGARSAVGVLFFVAVLTHPSTAAMLFLVLLSAAALRWVANRFRLRRTLEIEGPTLAAAFAGVSLGLLLWNLGLWGPRASISDSVLSPPYTRDFFLGRWHVWIQSLRPGVMITFGAVAVAWVLWRLVRREPLDRHDAISLLWLLPLVGAFGFVAGYTYPYYRFINLTLAPILLVGAGVWLISIGVGAALGQWALERRAMRAGGAAAGGDEGWRVGQGSWRGQKAARAAQLTTATVLLMGLLLVYLRPGLRTWNHQAEWVSKPTRVTAAGVQAYAAAEPGRPMVLLIYPQPDIVLAWSQAKLWSNLLLAGLAGDQVHRTFVYVGEPADLLARRPSVTGHAIFDRLSRGFLADMQSGLARLGEPPVALWLPEFNGSATPPSHGLGIDAAPGVEVVQGPGLAPFSPRAAAAARAAEARAAVALNTPEGLVARPGHLLQVLGGLFLLFVAPGLIGMRWFGLEDFPSRLALVVPLSLAMSVIAGVLVVAVHRGQFGPADAWASVALAVGMSVCLAFLGRRPRHT